MPPSDRNDTSYCGLNCRTCPAYVATAQNDETALAACARDWQTATTPLSPPDCRCRGCRQDEVIYRMAVSCPVRACARTRGVANCAHCSSYACDGLKRLWAVLGNERARLTLDDIRREML